MSKVQETLSYNIAWIGDSRRNSTHEEHGKLNLSPKKLRLKKGDRVIIEFPFDFEVREISKTTLNVDLQPNEYSDFKMYQIINDVANEQLAIRIQNDCLKDGIVLKDGSDYDLQIKEEYAIAYMKFRGFDFVMSKHLSST